MKGKACKQVVFLLLGLFLGFILFQFITSLPINDARTGYTLKKKTVKQYSYGKYSGIDEIVSSNEQYNGLAASLDVITRKDSRTVCVFKITIWNLNNSIRWLDYKPGYLDVLVLNQSGVVCSIREGFEPFSENYDVFLAPDGHHNVTFFWDGGFQMEGERVYLEDGLYYVVGVVRFSDENIELNPISLSVDTIEVTYRKYDTVPV